MLPIKVSMGGGIGIGADDEDDSDDDLDDLTDDETGPSIESVVESVLWGAGSTGANRCRQQALQRWKLQGAQLNRTVPTSRGARQMQQRFLATPKMPPETTLQRSE